MLELMIPPFVACLILTGIHAYLGVHVVERGVIFVDLALAQIAAMGSVCAILFGFSLHSSQGYLVSLGFTFAGAAIFSLTRFKKSDVPHEAIIGIVYVVSAAATILVLDRIPSEAQHIKEMLVGNILFVDWTHILKIFLLYAGIGIMHFVFRGKFILISRCPEKAESKGISVRFWDFLFYVSFGFVVTSSVELGGVLLVFSFLIIPAVCAVMFTRHFGKRLAIGWILGGVTSLVGVYASAVLDFPTGATVVCAFGGVIILAGILKMFVKSPPSGH